MGSPTWKLTLGPTADHDVARVLEVDARMPKADATHFQRDAEAITRLHVRGYIGDVKAKAARHALFKRIEKVLGVRR